MSKFFIHSILILAFSTHAYASCLLVSSNISATDGVHQDEIYITWSQAYGGVEFYEVYRATKPVFKGGVLIKLAETQNRFFHDTSASCDTLYYYWVKAKCIYGQSKFSKFDTGWRFCHGLPSPPLPPINVWASDGTYIDQTRITWSQSDGADYYEVYRAAKPVFKGGIVTKLAAVSGISFADRSAQCDTPYFYWVKAKNDYGQSKFSKFDTGWRYCSGLPSIPLPPTNVHASDGTYGDRVLITWNYSYGSDSYDIYRASNLQGTGIVKIGETDSFSFSDKGISPGLNYYYWVKSSNSFGKSNYSKYDSGYCAGACIDYDSDGYFSSEGCGTEVDCNDRDASIHPGAIEICNDGMDQDCNGSDLTDCCQGRSNPVYHINYFEICGNSENPIVKAEDDTVTLWLEVDWPFEEGGRVWVDDIRLIASNDGFTANILRNPEFDQLFKNWEHRENEMCLSKDTWCDNIQEIIIYGVWNIDGSVFHSPPYAARVEMPKEGYQTHIYQLPLIRLDNYPVGTEFRASAYVKIEGDLQVRLGLDFRDPIGKIRAVNGKVLQGDGNTSWRLLDLR